MRICAVESCDRKHFCKNYCKQHYRRFSTTGNPLGTYANRVVEKIDGEVWRDVVGFEGLYAVSNLGRVQRLTTHIREGGLLSQMPTENGYVQVGLSKNGVMKRFTVHRLVAKAFCPGESDGLEVCHNDGDKNNNHADNLRWDTKSANAIDKINHGNNPNVNKTRCPRGHEYLPGNLKMSNWRKGGRACRACANAIRQGHRYNLTEHQIQVLADENYAKYTAEVITQ